MINDKQTGIWGQAINLPLSQIPLIFGQTSITLQIQITGDGFDIFIEDKHCARLEHRKELPSKPCSLFLQFPSCDDYGSPENWSVYKTWWGNKAIMAKGDLAGIPGVNSFNAIHPVRAHFDEMFDRFLKIIIDSSDLALLYSLSTPAKTLCQRFAKDPDRSRSRHSTGRVGTGLSEIRWRTWCHLYHPNQHHLCICGNGE